MESKAMKVPPPPEKSQSPSSIKSLAYKIILAILIILLLIESALVIQRYTLRQTYMSQKILQQSKADIPAISVCTSQGYKPNELLKHGIPSSNRYNFKTNLTWSSNQSGVTPQKLFDEVTFKVTDLIQEVSMELLKPDEEGNKFVRLNLSLKRDFRENRHRKFGKCYSIHPEKRRIGIRYIDFLFRRDVKLYFHKAGAFLDFSGRMGYFVKTGQNLSCNVFYKEVSMLEKSKYWRLFDSNMFICSKTEYDECMNKALWDLMEAEAGCGVPWIFPNNRICTNDSKKINTTFWIAWNRVTNQEKDCNNPCEFQLINLASLSSQKMSLKNVSSFRVFFPSRVQVNTEGYLYLFLDAAAEIGGYVGILLGVSFYGLSSLIKGIAFQRLKTYKLTTEVEDIRKY